MEEPMYVCVCAQVTCQSIRSEIFNGLNTLEKLQDKLGVCITCCGCESEIRFMLDEHKFGRSIMKDDKNFRVINKSIPSTEKTYGEEEE